MSNSIEDARTVFESVSELPDLSQLREHFFCALLLNHYFPLFKLWVVVEAPFHFSEWSLLVKLSIVGVLVTNIR